MPSLLDEYGRPADERRSLLSDFWPRSILDGTPLSSEDVIGKVPPVFDRATRRLTPFGHQVMGNTLGFAGGGPTLLERPSYSGTMSLLHGQQAWEPPLTRFEPQGPEVRYGGVWGDAGVYLDNTPTGRWAFGEADRRFQSDRAFQVSAPFGKALVLTPDTLRDLRQFTAGAEHGGHVATKLSQAGYDGVILRGFDDALDPAWATHNARADKARAAQPPDVPVAELQRLAGEQIANEPPKVMARQAGLPEWVGDMLQDQVFAFKPERMTVGERVFPPVGHETYDWFQQQATKDSLGAPP